MGRMMAVVAAIALAVVAVACLIWPAAIQNYILRTQSGSWTRRLNPFADWMKRPSYRAYLRFMGIFMLLFDAILIVALWAAR